jgi:hypothetical protein
MNQVLNGKAAMTPDCIMTIFLDGHERRSHALPDGYGEDQIA